MTTAHDRLHEAYAATEPRPVTRPPFRPNDRLERLLVLRGTDPTIFAALGPATRLDVAYYEADRVAAGDTGGDPQETTP